MKLGRLVAVVKAGNVPGEFPYTAGIYPFKREGEDPTRMFAVKAVLNGPISAFIMYRLACRQSGSRQRSIR